MCTRALLLSLPAWLTTCTHTLQTLQALLLQNILLLFLVYHYQRRSAARSLTLAALLAGSGFVAVSGVLESSHVSALYDFNNAILIASR